MRIPLTLFLGGVQSPKGVMSQFDSLGYLNDE